MVPRPPQYFDVVPATYTADVAQRLEVDIRIASPTVRRSRPAGAATRPWTAVTALVLAALPGGLALAQTQQPDSQPVVDLASLDLEELAHIRVTSAGRKPESVARTSAAISVITREDIRRSAATSLPEALRLVPGLEVARVGTRDWAVSARGFNQQSSNKLLLLVDGRAVYSPIFAGVFWDALSVPFARDASMRPTRQSYASSGPR